MITIQKVKERFTLFHFERWLSAFPDDAYVGTAVSWSNCPLAQFLKYQAFRQEFCDQDISVEVNNTNVEFFSNTHDNRVTVPLSVTFVSFIRNLDSLKENDFENGRYVSALEAKQILNQLSKKG